MRSPNRKLQIMNVCATGKRADRLAQPIVIVMQQRQSFSKTQERRFIG